MSIHISLTETKTKKNTHINDQSGAVNTSKTDIYEYELIKIKTQMNAFSVWWNHLGTYQFD